MKTAKEAKNAILKSIKTTEAGRELFKVFSIAQNQNIYIKQLENKPQKIAEFIAKIENNYNYALVAYISREKKDAKKLWGCGCAPAYWIGYEDGDIYNARGPELFWRYDENRTEENNARGVLHIEGLWLKTDAKKIRANCDYLFILYQACDPEVGEKRVKRFNLKKDYKFNSLQRHLIIKKDAYYTTYLNTFTGVKYEYRNGVNYDKSGYDLTVYERQLKNRLYDYKKALDHKNASLIDYDYLNDLTTEATTTGEQIHDNIIKAYQSEPLKRKVLYALENQLTEALDLITLSQNIKNIKYDYFSNYEDDVKRLKKRIKKVKFFSSLFIEATTTEARKEAYNFWSIKENESGDFIYEN